MTHVITISGKAQHGKDTTADLIHQRLTSKGYNVLLTHYADLLKYICTNFFGWNGEKDAAGRSILQYVGTQVVRKERPDFWVDFIIDTLKLFKDEWDYVIIPDARFYNENDKMRENFDTITVRVTRPDFDNGLSTEQKLHESEVALDDYPFDFNILNKGDSSLSEEVNGFIAYLESRNSSVLQS